MNTANKLLDKFAAACLAKTDSEIAEKLRVTKSAVSNWRREKAHPDESTIEKMAEAIGEPVGPWLIAIQAERTHDARNRKVWLRHATTLGITLGMAAVAIVAFGNDHESVKALAASGMLLFDISKVDILVSNHQSSQATSPPAGRADPSLGASRVGPARTCQPRFRTVECRR